MTGPALELENAFIADASHELRMPLTVLPAIAEVGLTLELLIEKWATAQKDQIQFS